VIAVDTNLLVYAHRQDASRHVPAERVVRQLAESADPWAIPWPCVHEFLAVVTHPRIYRPPSTLDQAIAQVEAWRTSPSLMLLAEDDESWDHLAAVLRRAQSLGPAVHDARIAALCARHGVRELWSADRDFSRFAGLSVRNPLA
jgi:toxin-antitoxin system PIN domain toxin